MTQATKTKKTFIECLECGQDVVLTEQIKLGQEVVCVECGTRMEVVELDPVEVDWAYDEPDYDQDEGTEDW